jgi:2-C-methyl-D-erythritol 4-phosphate cytidylyltransferase/2-C-methyl-D-erythritol 2,4-cyclodiphosphate synthase
MKTVAIILAAGSGQRLGTPLPKQFLPVGGISILRHSILAFAHHPGIDAVIVVGDTANFAEEYARAMDGLVTNPLIEGGASRQESARAGLEFLADKEIETVLIHDAARPFVTRRQIDAVIEALKENQGAVLLEPVTDSLKKAVDGQVTDDVDRTGLYKAQTPQGFRYAAILDAHRRFSGREITDDVGVARAAGIEVVAILSDSGNFKITTPADLERARTDIESRLPDFRIGQGFDVHRLGPGTGVQLCGLLIPHDGSLIGHSDADVALHAVTDALLGTISDGDIGQHFPPSDERWKDTQSSRFVTHALGQIRQRGAVLMHIDLTIICERPKISPHREAMRQSLADLLSLDIDRVSVKATTTERLGVTGDGRGIAAQATATVRLPGISGDE